VRLSDDKITHLSHVLLKGLLDRGLVEIKDDEGAVRRAMKRAIVAELKIGEDMDEAARRKIASMSKQVVEGSPEWEVLYRKFFREEEVRRGRA
jgi:hypothetical protein